jgi:hypothetical protein
MARNPYDVTLERQAAKVPKIGPDKLRAYTGDVPLGSFTPPQREVDLTQDAYNRASQMGNIMRYGSPVDVRKETLGRINDARAQLASTAPKYPGADGVTEQDIGGVFDVAPEPKAASRAKTKENLLPYQERTYDTPYPTDESGVPIQDVSPEDISKIRTRRRGEEYAPTPKERTAITVGDLITKAITRNIPGSGKFFNVKENMTDYYGRPSWEQQYISDRASDYGKDVGASRSGGGNGGIMDLFPSQNTGTAPTTPTTGTPSSTTPKERPREHYYWDLGLNIPTPTDKNYTDYQNYLRQRAAARAAMYGTT